MKTTDFLKRKCI